MRGNTVLTRVYQRSKPPVNLGVWRNSNSGRKLVSSTKKSPPTVVFRNLTIGSLLSGIAKWSQETYPRVPVAD
jgi:hypothetical protein